MFGFMGSRVPDAPILRHHVCPEGLECANGLLVFAVRMAQGEAWLMISELLGLRDIFTPQNGTIDGTNRRHEQKAV